MKKTSLILILPMMFLMSACSTDFDINADWKDIALVYGLIDHTNNTQYIKLNKGFLGNEDAFVMAQEPDSLFYPEARVFLEPLDDTSHIYDNYGDVIRIELEETLDLEKDSGIFAFDYNKIYFTNESLDPQYNYQLLIRIPGKEKITSTTSLIDDLHVEKPGNNLIHKVGFATSDEYISYKAIWTSHPIGELYGLMLRCHYREITMDGETDKYVDWYHPTKRKFRDDESMELEIEGLAFYQFIAGHIDPGIIGTKRLFLGVDFVFTVAGEELASYIDVNGPSEGIVQERPSFTNISNGIGVFSSRYSKTIELVQLSTLTTDMLFCGELTKHLRFADQYGNYDCLNAK